MTARVLATGVTLSPASAGSEPGDELVVAAQIWAEVELDGEPERWGGSSGELQIVIGRDPTKPLLEAAHQQREDNLGNILGDLRIAGHDVTRWECYSAPFRIELSDRLRQLLSSSWEGRDPLP